MEPERFKEQIAAIINMEGRESNSNTPDFLLAEFMVSCLVSAEHLINAREAWYGYYNKPGQLAPTNGLLLRPSLEEVERIRKAMEAERGGPLVHHELRETRSEMENPSKNPSKKASKLEAGTEAVVRLINQVGDLEALTSKLCGPIPENCSTDSCGSGPSNMEDFLNGLPNALGELEKRIICVRDRLERLM